MTKLLRLVLGATLVVGLAACSKDTKEAVVKLDGSPRVSDQAGVVVKADREQIILDGNRTYEVASDLIAFSTFNRAPVRLGSTVGEYVQVGLEGKTVVWLARIGPVTTQADGRSSVIYQGDLVRVAGSRLEFRDGTVLTLAKGLRAPTDASGPTIASINPTSRVVEGATFAPPASTTTTRPGNP